MHNHITNIKVLSIVCVLALLLACKTQFGLVHTVKSLDELPVAVKNLGDITVTIEPFTEETWVRIAAGSQFIDRSKSGRLPKIPFFLILIENKSSQPIILKEIAITYGKTRSPMLTNDECKSYLSSPAYGFINVDAIITPQRLLAYSGKVQNIDFSSDVIPCTLPFIPSGDIHCMVVAGKWIPVQERQFTVEITIKSPDNEKIVDCTFVRKEYRTKGNHFLVPGGRND